MIYSGSDTIAKFETASEQRFIEAEVLRSHSHNLGAIYLFGYAIERKIKAAYFKTQGFERWRPISAYDRNLLSARASLYGFEITHQHDFAGWARLLFEEKRSAPAGGDFRASAGYDTAFGSEMVSQALRAYAIWRPEMRYSPYHPPDTELQEVHEASHWFQHNYPSL